MSYKTKRLLYQASVDGISPSIFHQLCEKQGPTVTFALLSDGRILGGFTSLQWSSTNTYQADSTAFLFTVPAGTSNVNILKVNSANVGNATYHHQGYGPTFGGHDLHLPLQSPLVVNTNSPHSYPHHGVLSGSALTDVLVWAVKK